jgi:hypothetical protein
VSRDGADRRGGPPVTRSKRQWIGGTFLALATTGVVGATYGYAVWRRGDDLRIPGLGLVRRFPCGDYAVPSNQGGVQAFEIIDRAAVVAASSGRSAVRTLVDAVFDREVPAVRCGHSLRRRVAEAEWRFRRGTYHAIAEQRLSEVTNDVLAHAAAPAWARVSAEEVHLLRTMLRPEVPHLVGTIGNQVQLSDHLSPLEAALVLITLGNGMLHDADEFGDGPAAYVERMRQRQRQPQAPVGVIVTFRAGHPDVTPDLNTPDSLIARTAHRLLDRLDVPP